MTNRSFAFLSNSKESLCENEKVAENKISNIIGILFILSVLHITFGGIASKGLRGISHQGTRKVKAGYNPSHTSETLIGYTAC